RYTFIGEPGQRPISLRQSLLEKGDPALLEKLFRTFGPNWWMQRRPYTFLLLQEYDRKLPSHYTLEPATGKGRPFDGQGSPADYDWQPGDLVALSNFRVVEMKDGGQRLSLEGARLPGQAPLRLRWLGTAAPEGAVGRIVATRDSLLKAWTADFDLLGLPDPLAVLPERMAEQVSGTQSPIHGDLNLENILVGPGGFVWLIDFANTRDGHPLFDFAHLAAEIVAHILTPQVETVEEYLALLREGGGPLLRALEKMAGQCLFNADNLREYYLALYMSCLGALKYGNLDEKAKYRLYLTAAYLVGVIG
ncbi:MAG: phosphotransferase, partial [Candidatus Promineifilaceae bacterium]